MNPPAAEMISSAAFMAVFAILPTACAIDTWVRDKFSMKKVPTALIFPADSSTFNFVNIIHFKRTAKSRNLIVMMRNIDPWWDYTYSYATEEESMPFY